MKIDEGQEYQYDVCLSFAGEQRRYVEQVADELRQLHVRVFYDDFEKANLWGKNLFEHLDWVYRQAAQFSVFLFRLTTAGSFGRPTSGEALKQEHSRRNVSTYFPPDLTRRRSLVCCRQLTM